MKCPHECRSECRSPSWSKLRVAFGLSLLIIVSWDTVEQIITWKAIDDIEDKYLHHDGDIRIGPRPWRNSPRIICFDRRHCKTRRFFKRRKEEAMSRNESHDEDYYDPGPILRNAVPREDEKGKRRGKCTIAAKWQKTIYPTCNQFHELEFGFHSEQEPNTSYHNKEKNHTHSTRRLLQQHRGESMELIGLGTSRDSWKVTKDVDTVVLKTLQIKTRDFSADNYHHQQVDAIASERLSSSQYILDIYGFCGLSVLNEIGIEIIARKLSTTKRLQYSRDLAAGMADIHGIDNATNAMVVHADMRVSNAMFSYDRKSLKLGDFNQAFLLGWNKRTESACGYDLNFTFWNDRFAAPEECLLQTKTEETDVYHMGGMLFFLLTGKKPYGVNPDDYKNREELWGNGTWVLPTLPDDLIESRDHDIIVMRKAMEACLRFEKKDRATAKQIHAMLNKAVLSSQKREQDSRRY